MQIKNLIPILLLALSVPSAQAESKGDGLFERALENSSTAPNYVLITVIDDKTKETTLICTEAPFLLGAIHKEYNLPYSDDGIQKAKSLALAQEDRVFRFSQSTALNNLVRNYTKAQLDEMRTALLSLSNEEILKGFKGDGTGLDRLYMERSGQYSAYRDAIAHVLLEKGLLPARGSVAGYLTVEKNN